MTYPTLLQLNPPKLNAYTRETVVAEKLEAMVKLGLTNSRMKDFYDLWVMARTFSFMGSVLGEAIRATFTRRATEIPTSSPIALTAAFAQDETKKKQWQAFRKRSGLAAKIGELPEVLADLEQFLLHPLRAASAAETLSQTWKVGGPWENAI